MGPRKVGGPKFRAFFSPPTPCFVLFLSFFGVWGKFVDRVSSFDHLQCQCDMLE